MIKLLCFLLAFLPSLSYAEDVYVKGYTRKDGTYVQGHYRSAPNGTASDNFSTYGNVNPYTGKSGTKRIESYPNSNYAPEENRKRNYVDQPIKALTKFASCQTNDGEKFSIKYDNDILTAKGKYKAWRENSSSSAWALYSNKGYSYYVGNIHSGKAPIIVTNKWGLKTSGFCLAQ